MTQHQPNTSNKIQSPHPSLQAILSNLRTLSEENQRARPIFDNRAKAQLFIDIQGRDGRAKLWLTPVWRIDHDDLTNSEIQAWSVTRFAC